MVVVVTALVSDLLPSTVSLLVFGVPSCNLFPQHPFVTQLLTRNLIIELLDMANNPELHSSHSHSMDDTELEVGHDCKHPTSWLEVSCCVCCDDHCVGVLMGRRLAMQLQIRSSQLGNTCLQRGHYLKNNVRALAHSTRCSVPKLGQTSDYVQLLVTSCMSNSFIGPQAGWSPERSCQQSFPVFMLG